MPNDDQIPYTALQGGFDDSIFIENPEPRCPCILLLDKSVSMSGQPITELNRGLTLFKDELIADDLAAKRVEVAVVSFGPVTVDNAFAGAEQFLPPRLAPEGDTPMGQAINTALDMLEDRKRLYRANGIAYYRPWVFLITDGGPTDAWQEVARRVREGEEKGAFAFFAIGVQGARMDMLQQISSPSRPPVKLDGLRFRDLFQWLSKSLQSVSRSQVGTTVPLAPPGWTSV
jgi:uncharacterized protein YegL